MGNKQRKIRDAIILANAGGDDETVKEVIKGIEISVEEVEKCDLPADYLRGKNQLIRIINGSD